MMLNNVLKNMVKKKGDTWEINLSEYKILGVGNIKTKMIIFAKDASKSAIEKIKKAGGEIRIISKVDKEKKPAKIK